MSNMYNVGRNVLFYLSRGGEFYTFDREAVTKFILILKNDSFACKICIAACLNMQIGLKEE